MSELEHDYYGQFDPPVDKFIYDRYSRQLPLQGCYIECGSFDGVISIFFCEEFWMAGYKY